jgi:antirestriction protein ArdC
LNGRAGFGNEEYSQEELTAEIGASILRALAGIDHEAEQRNSDAYLLSWLKALKNDPKMIVYASGRAMKAVDFLMGTDSKENDVNLEMAC